MKSYIGDGVYAEFEDGNIVLTTENGIRVQNTVILEPQVLVDFILWIRLLPYPEYHEIIKKGLGYENHR